MSCLNWQSFCQIDHNMLRWTVLGVNWLNLCQEWDRVVFWARHCSSCTHRSLFPFWRKSLSIIRWLNFVICCTMTGRQSYSSRIPEPWPQQGLWVVWPLGMILNASKTKSMIASQVTHNASRVAPINYCRNFAEEVWWPWYVGSDIWFQDDFWEASSLGFQSSFSYAW